MARFVRKWLSEWETEPPRYGRASQILNHLIDTKPDEAWERILALISEAKPESLCYVAAGPLEDLLSHHGPTMIERIEALAASDPRFLSCLVGVWGHTRFEPAIYAQVQRLIDHHPRNDDERNEAMNTEKIIDVVFKHPLIGTWTLGDSTDVEYTISALGKFPVVTGIDRSDGELLAISDISWNGTVLRFKSHAPSNNYELLHIFRSISEVAAEHEWTRVELWTKKP